VRLITPQTAHGLARGRPWTSEVRGRCLTYWAEDLWTRNEKV